MFWVFCNVCFVRPSQGKKRQFFVTSCSHILCNNCTTTEAKTCKKCGAACMIVQCNAQMPDEVKEVFCEIGDKVPSLMKVLDYQGANRARLMTQYRTVFQKYKVAKKYIKDTEQKINMLKQKCEAYKAALNKQQANVDILMKKYQWYKEKCSNIMSPTVRTPTVCQTLQSNLTRSRQNITMTPISGIASVLSTNVKRTPVSNYRTNMNVFRTPESAASSRRTSNSSGSSNSRDGSALIGFSPPSRSMEFLSLSNKNH